MLEIEKAVPSWIENLSKEHALTARVLAAAEEAFADPVPPTAGFVADLREYLADAVGLHHRKEERALFPVLLQRAGAVERGLVDAMVADHARAHELAGRIDAAAKAYLEGDAGRLGELVAAVRAFAALDAPHRRQEDEELLPLAARLLSPDDAEELLAELVELEREAGWGARDRYWKLADEIVARVELRHLSAGLAPEVLAAILDTLPVQLTFIDADDRVRYFSHERRAQLVERSREVIGNEVSSCHPQKSYAIVEEILRDLEAGRRDEVELWFDAGPRKILARYRAVRDEAGTYLGCLEVMQDVTGIQKLTGQKRTLDPIG